MTDDRLQPPAGWVDPRQIELEYTDVSKVPKYESDIGFIYWVDLIENGVTTSDPSVFFRKRGYSTREYGFSFGEVHFDGHFVVLQNDDLDPWDEFAFGSVGEADGHKTWSITKLFGVLSMPDVWRYRWLGGAAPKTTVKGLDGFESREQQERFIKITTTLLSIYGNVLEAKEGRPSPARAVFSDELKKKFEEGDLIR